MNIRTSPLVQMADEAKRPTRWWLAWIVGIVLVIGGLVMVPLPGPGWLVVILGLAILASEFEPAQRVLDFVKAKVRAWERWVRSEPWWVQGFFALLTAAFCSAALGELPNVVLREHFAERLAARLPA